MEENATEADTIVGGERAEANERMLHAALRRRAAALRPRQLGPASRLFQSFFIGGFECATHRRRDGRRLDLLAATQHDVNAAAD